MNHPHPSPQRRCDICQDWPDESMFMAAALTLIARELHKQSTILNRIDRRDRRIMTNQEHLEQDVTAIGASVATAVQELKDQIAAGTQANALDFSSLDALAASTAAEAGADAPPAPPA